MLLVTAYWQTNLTLRQLAPLFGISKSSADRIIGHIGPLLALKQRQRFHAGTMLIADGTLAPTRDHRGRPRDGPNTTVSQDTGLCGHQQP